MPVISRNFKVKGGGHRCRCCCMPFVGTGVVMSFEGKKIEFCSKPCQTVYTDNVILLGMPLEIIFKYKPLQSEVWWL